MDIFYTYFISTHYTLYFQWNLTAFERFFPHINEIDTHLHIHSHYVNTTICPIFAIALCAYIYIAIWIFMKCSNFYQPTQPPSVCMLIINPSESQCNLDTQFMCTQSWYDSGENRIHNRKWNRLMSCVCRQSHGKSTMYFLTVNVQAFRFINGTEKEIKIMHIAHIQWIAREWMGIHWMTTYGRCNWQHTDLNGKRC